MRAVRGSGIVVVAITFTVIGALASWVAREANRTTYCVDPMQIIDQETGEYRSYADDLGCRGDEICLEEEIGPFTQRPVATDCRALSPRG